MSREGRGEGRGGQEGIVGDGGRKEGRDVGRRGKGGGQKKGGERGIWGKGGE